MNSRTLLITVCSDITPDLKVTQPIAVRQNFYHLFPNSNLLISTATSLDVSDHTVYNAMDYPKSSSRAHRHLKCSGVSVLNPADSRRHGQFVELTYSYNQDPQEFKYRKVRYSHAGASSRWRARPANASAMVSHFPDDE